MEVKYVYMEGFDVIDICFLFYINMAKLDILKRILYNMHGTMGDGAFEHNESDT